MPFSKRIFRYNFANDIFYECRYVKLNSLVQIGKNLCLVIEHP